MAYTTFEEGWQKAPEEIQDFLSDNAYKFADKYLTLFEKSEDYMLFINLTVFLQKIGVKYYEVPNLYTLQYLIENVLNLDKEFAQKLAEVIWNDFIPAVNKVWQGKEVPQVILPEKEERLQKAILAQMERETTVKQPEEAESLQEKIINAETTTEATEEEIVPKEEKSTEKKIPIETSDKALEEAVTAESPESIPIVTVPTMSWGEEKKQEITKEPKIIIEEKEKLTEKTEPEGPIDVSSY